MFFSPNWPCFGILTSPLWPFWKKKNHLPGKLKLPFNLHELKQKPHLKTNKTIPATSPKKQNATNASYHSFQWTLKNPTTKIKIQLLLTSLLRRQLVGHMRAMRRPQQPRLRFFGGAHGGGDVGLQAVEAGQGHGARRHGTSSLGPLGGLGRKTHLAGFHGNFFGGWWVFFGWSRWRLGGDIMELDDDGHFMAGLGLGFLLVQSVLILGSVEYTNPPWWNMPMCLTGASKKSLVGFGWFWIFICSKTIPSSLIELDKDCAKNQGFLQISIPWTFGKEIAKLVVR